MSTVSHLISKKVDRFTGRSVRILLLECDGVKRVAKVAGPPGISRDVTDIGHQGTGDLEITVRGLEDIEAAKAFIEMAYQRVGG